MSLEHQRILIIAEAGVNHNGSPDLARALVHAAADAGADAVKFQTFSADRLVTEDARKAAYQERTSGGEETQHAMLKRLELPEEGHYDLQEICQQRAIEFMSTPFDEQSADFLAELGVRRFKIPSGEITNLPFLRHVARQGLPIILSTGMSRLGEVEAAVDAIVAAGCVDLSLLHCVSAYPAPIESVNLRAMDTLFAAFRLPVGFSDHTMGIEIPIAAAALGAVIIEKHLTLDRALPGPDHAASLTPDEFARMVDGIRNVEAALGDGRKAPRPVEHDVAAAVRKSLVAATAISAGEVITESTLAIRRPGGGLAPSAYDLVLGRKARTSLPAGTLLSWEHLQ